MKDIAIVAGSSSVAFASRVCSILGIELTKTNLGTFGNGEVFVEIDESVRDKDVFVFQSSSDTPNGHLMELFLLLDALKRSSCYRVTTVMPNFPYARQDRKVRSRVPISAKLVANLITEAGTDRFLTAEFHSPQIAGFFDVPVDNLYSAPVFLNHIKENNPDNNICLVAPDAGSVKVAKMYSGRLECDVAMIYKNRSGPGKIKEMKLIGEVADKNCIIVDDMADSCGTIAKASNILMTNGARSVRAYCTHAVLSGEAERNLHNSNIDKLYVSDTIVNPKTKYIQQIEILSIADLFADAIKNINEENSMKELFYY